MYRRSTPGGLSYADMMNLFEVAKEISDRLTGIFLRDEAAGGLSTVERRNSRPTRTGATTACSTGTSMG
jgi:hypothetical protein